MGLCDLFKFLGTWLERNARVFDDINSLLVGECYLSSFCALVSPPFLGIGFSSFWVPVLFRMLVNFHERERERSWSQNFFSSSDI